MSGGVLVLWDVDHTLVDAAGVGVRAFRIAFRQVFGRDDAARLPPMSGRTDRAIVVDLLRANGIADPDRHLEDFRAAAERALADLDGALRAEGRALPGAADALRALSRETAVQTLLTGNIRAFAEAKMRAFALAEHLDLDIGAYGWAHAVRARLVDMARAAAGARHGREFTGRSTVLVGDTPRDVEAALDSGAAVVGVATGGYGVAELRAAGAHVVLGDLTDTPAVLAAITSAARPD
ncbi:HAD family hydrolase [Planosporangium sp. 12N6]|uniref:HAD family hydrolase n=1 Tax=Planosporangium spinosum TaxID=3402278 RepID=UPI003CF9A549